MVAVAFGGAPMIALGVEPVLVAGAVAAFAAGFGIQLVGLSWDLAMQEHVPDEMLSRAYSYDMLGSFVAIPVGQLIVGPLAAVFGVEEVMLVAGIAYAALALATLASRSVRDLPRVTVTEPVSTTCPPTP